MNRLIEYTVFSGLVIAWRLATCPTSRSPVLVNATTDGVVRPPSSLGITLGSPPSITATQELVVPRSIPIIFAINLLLGISAALVCLVVGHWSWASGLSLLANDRRPIANDVFISALDSTTHLLALAYYES